MKQARGKHLPGTILKGLTRGLCPENMGQCVCGVLYLCLWTQGEPAGQELLQLV